MGRNKALLPWGDRTLVEAWVARFRESGVRRVIAVVGADAEMIEATVGPELGIEWARNPEPDTTGPRESFLLGLDRLGADAPVWFVPVDTPVVNASVLRRMRRAWRAAVEADPEGPGPLVALPSYRRQSGHPVLAGTSFIKHLYEGERGDRIDAVLAWATRRQLIVEVDDVRVVGNMNRPRDYEAFAPPAGERWDWSEEAVPPEEGDGVATLDLQTTSPGLKAAGGSPAEVSGDAEVTFDPERTLEPEAVEGEPGEAGGGE